VQGDNITDRVFEIVSGTIVTIESMTIRYGKANRGGGINNSGTLTLTNCSITENTDISSKEIGGAGIYNSGTGIMNLSYCTVNNNGSGGGYGGGIANHDGTMTLTNCIVAQNKAAEGGGIFSGGGTLTLTNCTVTGNIARDQIGSIEGRGDVSITNCIFCDNSQDGHLSYDFDVTYSDIADYSHELHPGVGNINEDPMFVDPDNGDYHLQVGSPCIDAGTSDGAPVDDLEGNPRYASPDMGAYEYRDTFADADIDIKPDTLNLKSKGKWITAYIELPEGYHATDIDVRSIRLEGEIRVEHSDMQDGVLMVKFDRQELNYYLGETTGYVTLTVSGELTDGTTFEGSDTIRVIDKGKK